MMMDVNKMPCYRREDRAMPLEISVRIEVYSVIARFLSHSTAFLYRPTSCSDRSNAEIRPTYTFFADFHGCDAKLRRQPKIAAHDR